MATCFGIGMGDNNREDLAAEALIYGLPHDIAVCCLARVPRKYHPVLRCVSKRWRDFISGEELCAYRAKHNLCETWIYALCADLYERISCFVLDPNAPRRGWKHIQGLPPRISKRKGVGFEVFGKKMYLLGGCSWFEDATNEVFCYNALTNKWSEEASLKTPRCYFACQVLDERIYAIGGLSSASEDPHSWDTYDPHTGICKSQIDPNIMIDIDDSMVMDEKIYIRSGVSPPLSRLNGMYYEPSSGTWEYIDNDIVAGWQGPAVVIDGTLYMLNQDSGIRLFRWEEDIREWVRVGKLSPLLVKPPCQLVATGRSIVVVGKGLSTAIFDVASTGNIRGIVVGSSIPSWNLVKVVSCRTMTL